MDRQKQVWKGNHEHQGKHRAKPLIPFLAALVVAAVLLTLGLTQFTQAGYLAQSGFAVSGDELGRLLKSGETGNVCLASVDMGDALFVRSLSRNTYYVGEEKTEINAGYPVFAREGQLLYFLDDSLSMVTENWEVLGTYEGLYLSEGTTFNADRQQADIDRVILVKVDGGYLLAQEASLSGMISDTRLPMNSICVFGEDSILLYTYQNGNLTGEKITVRSGAKITVGGETYDYLEFLEKLGLWEKEAEKPQETEKPGNGETETPEHSSGVQEQLPSQTTPGTDKPEQESKDPVDKPRDPADSTDKQPQPPTSEVEQPSAPPSNPDTPAPAPAPAPAPDTNPDYKEPTVRFSDTITPWVYTLTLDATISDPSAALRGGVQIYVYEVTDSGEKLALRRVITTSGEVVLGQLKPDTAYHVYAEYRYTDKLNYPRTVTIELGKTDETPVRTLKFEELGQLGLSFYDEARQTAGQTPVEVFSDRLQLRDLQFDHIATGTAVEVGSVSNHPATDPAKAESYVNMLVLHATDENSVTTEIRMDANALLLLREGYTLSHWETEEVLSSGHTYTYELTLTDRYGNQFEVETEGSDRGQGHTCMKEPTVTIQVPQRTLLADSVGIQVQWQNPDNAPTSANSANDAFMGGEMIAGLYLVEEGAEVRPENAIPLDAYLTNDENTRVTGQKFLPVTVNSDGTVTTVTTQWTVTNLGILKSYTAAVLCGGYDIQDGKQHVDETLQRTSDFVTVSLASLGTISYTSEARKITDHTVDAAFYMNSADERLLPLLSEVTLSLKRDGRLEEQTLTLLREELQQIPISLTEEFFGDGITVSIPVHVNGGEAQTTTLTLSGSDVPLYQGASPENVWDYLLATSGTAGSAWLTLQLGGELTGPEGTPIETLLTLEGNTAYTGSFLTQAEQGGVTCDVTNGSGDKLRFTTLSKDAVVQFENVFVSSNFIELYGLKIEDSENNIMPDDADRGGNNVLIRILSSSGVTVASQYINSAEEYEDLRLSGLENNETYTMVFYAMKYRQGNAMDLNHAIPYDSALQNTPDNICAYTFTTGASVDGSLTLEGISQLYRDENGDKTTNLSLLSSTDFYYGVSQTGRYLYYSSDAVRDTYLAQTEETEATAETVLLAQGKNSVGDATDQLVLSPSEDSYVQDSWTTRLIAVKPGEMYAIYNTQASGYFRLNFYYRNASGELSCYGYWTGSDNYMRGGVFRVPTTETSNSIYADRICYMRISSYNRRDSESMILTQYQPDQTAGEENLAAGVTMTEGMSLGSSNGQSFNEGYAFTEDYIPVQGGSIYELRGRDINCPDDQALDARASSYSYVLFYDKNYAFLGAYDLCNQRALIKAPFGAAYCRFNVLKNASQKLDMSGVSMKLYYSALSDQYRVDLRAILHDQSEQSILLNGTYTVTLYSTASSVSDSDDLTAQTYVQLGDAQQFEVTEGDLTQEGLRVWKDLAFENLNPGMGFRAELHIQPYGWHNSVLLDTVYFTTNRVTYIISDEAGLRAVRNDPAGSYLVIADIELKNVTSYLLSSDRPFTGTIDFQGHTLTTDCFVPLFYRISESGVVKNLVMNYNAKSTALTYQNYVAPVTANNYGTLQNIIIHYRPDNQAYGIDVRYSGGICRYNYGTIDGFMVQLMKDVHVYDNFGGVCQENYGTISNGYICTDKVTDENGTVRDARVVHVREDASGNILSTQTPYVGLCAGYNGARATIENVFVLGDLVIQSADASTDYSNADWLSTNQDEAQYYETSTTNTDRAAVLVGNSAGVVRNAFTVGDRLDCVPYAPGGAQYSYMLDRGPAVAMVNGRYTVENLTYFSNSPAAYSQRSSSDGTIGTYNRAGKFESLYDYTWYEGVLGADETRFKIRDNVDEGYYPQLILPDCFPADTQPLIPISDAVGGQVEVLSNQVRLQGVDQALVTVTLKFPYAASGAQVTEFQLVDRNNTPISCEVLSQRSVGDSYLVDVLISLPENGSALADSSYTITSVRWTGGVQNFTGAAGEREVSADFWRRISSVADWKAYLSGSTSYIYGNYWLTADLDFSASTSYGDWYCGQRFYGKLDGGIYETESAALTDSAGNPILSREGEARTILTRKDLTGMRTISGVGNTDSNGNWSRNRDGTYRGSLFMYLYGTMENLVFRNFNSVINSGAVNNTVNSAYAGVVAQAQAGSRIENCHVRDCTFYGSYMLGGLVGYGQGNTLRNSSARNVRVYNYKSETGTYNVYTGGLFGYLTGGMVDACFAADVTVEAKNIYNSYGVGGLGGYTSASVVQDCYSTGTVDCAGSYVGGILGRLSGSGQVTGCWSAASVRTVADYAGGVVGYHESGTLTNNYTSSTVVTQSLAASSVHRICSNVAYHESDRHDNYAFEGQYLTYTKTVSGDGDGTSPAESPYQFGTWDQNDGATALLSVEQLKQPAVWSTLIGVGSVYDLSGSAAVGGASGGSTGSKVADGWMPKLVNADSGQLLYDQPDVEVGQLGESVLTKISVGAPYNETFTVQLGLFSSAYDDITAVPFDELADWDHMEITGGTISDVQDAKATQIDGKVGRAFQFTVKYGDAAGENGHYMDSYILTLKVYHPDGTTEMLQVRISLDQPVYRMIYSIEDWDNFFSNPNYAQTFENVMIGWPASGGNIDFTQETSYSRNHGGEHVINVKVNRLCGEKKASGECPEIFGLDKVFHVNSQNLINQAVTEVADLTFRDISLVTDSTHGGDYKGIVASMQGNLTNVTFRNITVDGGTSYYVGCVGGLWGTADGVTLENVTIRTTNTYVGGLAGYAYSSATLKNVTLRATDGHRNTVTSTNGTQVGGLVGRLDGIGSNLSVTDLDVSAMAYAGGAVGFANSDGGRPSEWKLEHVTVGDPEAVSSTPGVLMDADGTAKPSVTVTSIEPQDGSTTRERRYFGGVAGHGGSRNERDLNAYNTLVEMMTPLPTDAGAGDYNYSVGGIFGYGGDSAQECSIKNVTVASYGGWCGGISSCSTGSYHTVEDSVIYSTSENGNYVGGISGNGGGVNRGVVKHSVIMGAKNVGGILGYQSGWGRECGVVDTIVLGTENVGGIAGWDNYYHSYDNYVTATLDDDGNPCETEVTQAMLPHRSGFTGSTYAGSYISGKTNVGGLLGKFTGVYADNSYVAQGVTVRGTDNVGGAIGQAFGWYSDSSWVTTNVYVRRLAFGGTVTGSVNVGGIMGQFTCSDGTAKNNTAKALNSSSYGWLVTGTVQGDRNSGFLTGQWKDLSSGTEPQYPNNCRVYENAVCGTQTAAQVYGTDRRYDALPWTSDLYLQTLTVSKEDLSDPSMYFLSAGVNGGGMGWYRATWSDEAMVSLYTGNTSDPADFASYSGGIAKDDLVLWLDAKNNTGNGWTDKDSTVWKDLSSGGNDAQLTWNGKKSGETLSFTEKWEYMQWAHGGLEFYGNGRGYYAELEKSLSQYLQSGYTVEMIYTYQTPKFTGHSSVLSWEEGTVAGGFLASYNNNYGYGAIYYTINSAGTGTEGVWIRGTSTDAVSGTMSRTAAYTAGDLNANGQGTLRYYINGGKLAEATATVSFRNTSDMRWQIGRGWGNGSYMMRVYGIRVYNRQLTDEELAQNAAYDSWYYFGGSRPEGAKSADTSLSLSSGGTLVRSENGGLNGELVTANYTGGEAGLGSRGYYYVTDGNGHNSAVYRKDSPSYGLLLRTVSLDNEYYGTTAYRNVRGQEGRDENGDLYDGDDKLYYGGFRLPDAGLRSWDGTVASYAMEEPVDLLPGVTAYASGADTVNLELTGDAPEGLAYTVEADGQTVLSGAWPSDSRTLTMTWDFQTAFTLTLTLEGETVSREWWGTDLSRTVMTYGDGYWYLYEDECLNDRGEALSCGTVVNMMNGRVLTGTGAVLDAASGQQLGTVTPFTLTEPTPLWSGTLNGGAVKSFGTYTLCDAGTLEAQMVVKGENVYTMPGSDLTVGSFLTDAYGGKSYTTVLTSAGTLVDLGDAPVYPEEFTSTGITETSNTLGYSGHKLLVRYQSGKLVAFDYLTGETDEVLSKTQDTSFWNYLLSSLTGGSGDHSTWKNGAQMGLASSDYQTALEQDPALLEAWKQLLIAGNGTVETDGNHQGQTDENAPGGVDGEAPGGTDADGSGNDTVLPGQTVVPGTDAVNGDGLPAEQPGEAVNGETGGEQNPDDTAAPEETVTPDGDVPSDTDRQQPQQSDKVELTGTSGGTTELKTRFVTVYDKETGTASVYSLQELLTKPEQELVAENDRAEELKQQGFEVTLSGQRQQAPSRAEANGLLLVIVTAAAAVVLLAAAAVLKRRKLEGKGRNGTDR